MKTILKILALLILMVASAVCCYYSAIEWQNDLLTYSSLILFSVFWACILYLSASNRIIDNTTIEIEDQEYTPDNVNYDK
jgi:asparagine N-glycosylation enzyme membrane subunit Stt3